MARLIMHMLMHMQQRQATPPPLGDNMEKLIAQLLRLYIPAGTLAPQSLADHLLGRTRDAPPLVTADGLTRCVVIPFDKALDGAGRDGWTRLCEAAHALQADHGLPAPAVSIDGEHGFCLWISLETPVPAALADRFVERVRAAWSPGSALRGGPRVAALPPCLNRHTGKWAAFIHPGMGASFADEPGLDIAPPPAAQAAFLEDLESAGLAPFQRAVDALAAPQQIAPAAAAPLPAPAASAAAADGLLLKDATLEDIVRFLHAKNIEPSFRFRFPSD
ncbi:MAG: hypothetical protein V7631_2582 [Massilia sp.]|jgi:hypothetical protein